MAALAEAKGVDARHVVTIPHWADNTEIYPLPKHANDLRGRHGLGNQFVVQYCGNMGRTHGLDCLLAAAEGLRSYAEIVFLFVGSGARYRWLEERVENWPRRNIILLPRCSREALNDCLNAGDIGLISLIPGMRGVSVPSRMYNIMAAGKPLLAIADDDSEPARVVREERIGWVVTPGDSQGIIDAVLEAQAQPDQRDAMGQRASKAAQSKYCFDNAMGQYRTALTAL
jgi:glycosyltransferase involved in cell wall biosynthesis